jgi:hypothetical protein
VKSAQLDRPLNTYDLLHQIQDAGVRKTLKSKPLQLPGPYRLDDLIHVAETPGGEFAWCPIEKDELIADYDLLMPEENRWRLQDLARAGIDFDRDQLFIIHELPGRGHKQQIEQTQHIPIELIKPISKQEHIRQELSQKWQELASWSKPRLVQLAEAIKSAAPNLAIVVGAIIGGVIALAVIVVLIQAIITILASIVVGFILVAGLAAGASGVDPILIGAIHNQEDGTSTLYYLTHYRYPVRKTQRHS